MPSAELSLLAIGVAGAGVLALVVAPMRFSWPRQVRWCVAMQALTTADPTMVASRIDLREVRLARVALAERRTGGRRPGGWAGRIGRDLAGELTSAAGRRCTPP